MHRALVQPRRGCQIDVLEGRVLSLPGGMPGHVRGQGEGRANCLMPSSFPSMPQPWMAGQECGSCSGSLRLCWHFLGEETQGLASPVEQKLDGAPTLCCENRGLPALVLPLC